MFNKTEKDEKDYLAFVRGEIYNWIDSLAKTIKKCADEQVTDIELDVDTVNIISVGRLIEQKSYKRLLSIHNIRFLIKLTEDIREAIENDTFDEFKKEFIKNYTKK